MMSELPDAPVLPFCRFVPRALRFDGRACWRELPPRCKGAERRAVAHTQPRRRARVEEQREGVWCRLRGPQGRDRGPSRGHRRVQPAHARARSRGRRSAVTGENRREECATPRGRVALDGHERPRLRAEERASARNRAHGHRSRRDQIAGGRGAEGRLRLQLHDAAAARGAARRA